MIAERNAKIAERLREAADILGQQGANPFRVSAYRRAADTVAGLARDIGDILREEGTDGLERLPHIGESIAAAIAQMVRTGRWAQLDRLRGELDPEKLFRTVPGIGPATARRIHDTLHIDTLEALELAAHDGRLETVPSVGRRRAAAWRASLADMLGRVRARPQPAPAAAAPRHDPDVAMLLDVDREYREKAAAGKLSTIAPRRFNPTGEAWLPVLHTSRGDWHFTALFSNTARAHELGRTRDWVVLYFADADHAERQCTVVTESRGGLAGERVVRGREAECRDYYGAQPPTARG